MKRNEELAAALREAGFRALTVDGDDVLVDGCDPYEDRLVPERHSEMTMVATPNEDGTVGHTDQFDGPNSYKFVDRVEYAAFLTDLMYHGYQNISMDAFQLTN